jgi:hypothetical protein
MRSKNEIIVPWKNSDANHHFTIVGFLNEHPLLLIWASKKSSCCRRRSRNVLIFGDSSKPTGDVS